MTRLDKIYNNIDEEILRLVDKHQDILREVINYLNEEVDE